MAGNTPAPFLGTPCKLSFSSPASEREAVLPRQVWPGPKQVLQREGGRPFGLSWESVASTAHLGTEGHPPLVAPPPSTQHPELKLWG